jgi:hypothetical protein
MNQRSLYTSLKLAGCKILSFEDYPSNLGSWRVCFFIENTVCEVRCIRTDNLLILTSKNTFYGNNTAFIETKRLVTDQLELTRVLEWLQTISAGKKIALKSPELNDVYIIS